MPNMKKRTSLQLLSQGDERGPYISGIDWKLMKKKNEE